MKLQNAFLASAMAVLALSSCGKDNEFTGAVDTSDAIEFSSSIAGGDAETRLDGTTWAGGEAVGIFMLDASTSAFSVSDNGTNKEYTGQEDGSLAPKSSALTFPTDNSEVRFMAYYPYQKSADAGTYTIDLTKDGDNDLLFASDPTGYNALSEGKVELSFSHKLSKLQLTLANDISGAAIDASKVTMRAEMRTAGTFSLKTQEGELTIGDAVNEVSMPVVAVSGKAVGSVIVFPTIQQSNGTSTTPLNSVSKLIFDVDGKEYICDDATMLENLVSNNQYNYDVVLSEDAKAVVSLTSTIQAWTVVDKGTLIATPTDGDDTGNTGGNTTTGQKIADVRALAPADGESVVIAQEMTVTGSVIAQNDPSGSFYKAIIISDGEAALYIYDEETSKMSWAVGDEVTVDLNGATLKNYNGLLEAMSTGTDYALSAKITKTGNTKVIAPVVVSAADLANYQSMLVTIKDAKAPEGTATWGASDANTTIEMSSSTGAFNVYTSKYSNFKGEAVPTGTGDLTGIVGWYKAPQIIFASTDGWAGMTGTSTGGNTTTGQKIADVRALAPADGESVVIAQEMTVTGSVIAQNDPSGSFYKAIIISDGEAALYIYDETTAQMSWAIGDEVTVDLNGATLKNYNGLLEAMSTGTDYALSAKITKTGNTKVIAPVVVSAADLANYQSMLVTIKDAKAPEGTATWGASDANTTIEMSSSTGAFNVYTSKYSNFKTEAVPTGTGDVTGIVGWYKAPQIIFASTDGWAGMTGTSTGGDTGNTGGDTGNTGSQTIADVRALAPADGQSVVISQAMTVTGSVIAQNDPSGSFYKAIIISDGVSALYIYDDATSKMSWAIGDEVTVDLNGATLKNYNGLLEAMSTGSDYELSTKITKTGNTKVIAPKVVKASELANYQSMYVTIESAKAADGAPANWGASDANTTVAMTSSTGDFNIYTSKYCNFKDAAIGTGTGSVSGIVGWYKAPQLIFSKASDYANL